MSRASYLSELQQLRQRLDALLEQALGVSALGPAAANLPDTAGTPGAPGTWSPPVDLYETPEEYVLLADVPGLDRQDIDLEVQGRRLSLAGNRVNPSREGRFHRVERSYGRFQRIFELDHDLDPERIEARLEGGLLRIRVAKKGAERVRVETQD